MITSPNSADSIDQKEIDVGCQWWCRYPTGALASVRGGAKIGLLSPGLRVSQGASLGDFLFVPACLIVKVTLWVGLL